MSLVFSLCSLLSLRVRLLSEQLFAVKKRALLALIPIAFLLSAPVSYTQDSSAANTLVTPPAAEQPTAEVEENAVPATHPKQMSLSQNSSPVVATNTKTAPVSNSAVTPIGSGRHLVNVTLALMGIIGLIFAISWFVRRFSQGGFAASSTIKILAAMPLGTRERIVLIDAGGQQLLVGITATNINTLHVFETPIVIDNAAGTQSDFSRKLMAVLQQKSPLASMQDTNNKNNSAP